MTRYSPATPPRKTLGTARLQVPQFPIFRCFSRNSSTYLQTAQRHHRAQDAQNVKTDDYLVLVPVLFFEMMMDRRHQKYPFSGPVAPLGVFEITPLQNHR